MATIGLYSVVATILWDWWLFDIALHIENWPVFVLSILMATVTIALFGFLLSVTAVRYRTSWALGAALEYPGWLLCGFVVPLDLLPDLLRPISWALAADLGGRGDAGRGRGRERRGATWRSVRAVGLGVRGAGAAGSAYASSTRPAATRPWPCHERQTRPDLLHRWLDELSGACSAG